MSVQGHWAELKTPDFQAVPEDCVAVLPLGATEQHGPHLPLSVDYGSDAGGGCADAGGTQP